MKLVVGLGNPGNNYRNTRHNIGYRVVRKLAESYKIKFKRSFMLKSLIAQTQVVSVPVLLALPYTFMNLSGSAVGRIVKRNKLELKDILVVCDDIDTVFGKIKIRPSGSDGGHQGLRSIIEALGKNDFARLKIGVGRPQAREDVVEYVLSYFNKEEEAALAEVIDKAADCCQMWLEYGLVKTMNKFN